jgi:hypothetical protein
MAISGNKLAIMLNSVKKSFTLYFISVLFIHALDLARLCERLRKMIVIYSFYALVLIGAALIVYSCFKI